MKDEDQNIHKEIDIKEIISVTLKRSWLILALMVLFGFIAFVVTENYITPAYESTSTLFIGRDPDSLTDINIGDIQLDSQLVSDYKELVNTRVVIEQVIDELDMNASRMEISEKLEIEVAGDSRFMHLSFVDSDPVVAMEVVNTLSDVLVDKAQNIVGARQVQIVDRAMVPTTPMSPNVKTNVVISVALGVVVAFLVIFIQIILDDTIKREKQLVYLLGVPVFGVIPKFEGKRKKWKKKINSYKKPVVGSVFIKVENDPSSAVSESFKTFRTNLNFKNVGGAYQVLLFASTKGEEGKTTTVCNTAVSFAKDGKKTLLIEADLRGACIHELFDIPQSPGLTDILKSSVPYKNVIQPKPVIENLDIITAGQLPKSPTEVLGSRAFDDFINEAKSEYDIIIIDAPPMQKVSDAAIISRVVAGVILVVAVNESTKEEVLYAKDVLEKIAAPLVGTVMTKARVR